MELGNKKSGGSTLLIILLILAFLFLFKINLKGLFESQQFKDNVAYLESKTKGFFNFFIASNPISFSTLNSTVNTNQPLAFPSIDPSAIGKIFQMPSFNMSPTDYPQVPQSQNPTAPNNAVPQNNTPN